MTVRELIEKLQAMDPEDQRLTVEVRNRYDSAWVEFDTITVVPEEFGTWDKEREVAIHKTVRLE